MTNKKQKPTKEDSIDNDDELKSNNQASFAFIFVLLTIGLPLWYETTKVYRANLPYEEISALNETLRLLLKFRVNLLVVDKSTLSGVKALQKSAEENFSKLDIHKRLTVEFAFSTQSLAAEYRDALIETRNIDQFDKNFTNHQLIGHGLNIIIIDEQNEFTNFDLFLGRRNIFYCRWEFCRENLYFILLDVFISRENLIDICVKNFDKRILDKDKKTRKKLTDNTKVNHKVAFFPKYTVSLALLFPDYNPNNRSAVENLIKFLHGDFSRFSRRLRNLTEINFISQSLYFVDFDQKPSYNRKLKRYFYDYDHLSRLISGVEPYLSSGLSDINRETLHFLIYFPSKDKSGIVFGNPGDNEVENEFIVRNWGAVSIIDLINGNVETFEDIRSTVFSQVRHLLGFYSPKSSKFQVITSSSALSTWDLRRLAIEAILDYNFECVATLNSITKLLSEITNIVINDHVADSIKKAITSAKKSINGLKSDILDDRTLGVSRQQAEIARYHSEKAFFDESLLSLLYFPDDQKYAIYVPLFLPVLLPVVWSLVFLFKRSWASK